MLKFSGYANLTSCLKYFVQQVRDNKTHNRMRQHVWSYTCIKRLTNIEKPCQHKNLKGSSMQTNICWGIATYNSLSFAMKKLLKQCTIDTEASMLLGISQKHNMCSSPCRLTEFCNSQCLSHFAAPFISARTETSIAENCELFLTIVILQCKVKLFCIRRLLEWTNMFSNFVHPNTHWYLQELKQLAQIDST